MSKVPGIIGTTGLALAVISEIFIPPGENIPQSDIDQHNHNRKVLALSSVSLIISSIIMKKIGKKQVKKANKLRVSLSE